MDARRRDYLPPVPAEFQIAYRRSHRFDTRRQVVGIEVDMPPDTPTAGDGIGFRERWKRRGKGGIAGCPVQMRTTRLPDALPQIMPIFFSSQALLHARIVSGEAAVC
jgi:hypothetical protein